MKIADSLGAGVVGRGCCLGMDVFVRNFGIDSDGFCPAFQESRSTGETLGLRR